MKPADMPSESKRADAPNIDREITGIVQSFHILRAQVQAGRVETDFLLSQITRLLDWLPRVQAQTQQIKNQQRWEALYRVTRLLGSSLDLQTVLDQVMDAVIELTGAERGFLMLRSDTGPIEVVAARNLDRETITGDRFEISRTIINRIIDSGDSLLTTNAAADPRFNKQDSILRSGLRSIMAAPLRARGRVIGVCYVDNRAAAGIFNTEDLAALEMFASQAAIAIDNAQLFNAADQKLAARLEELQQLRQIDLQLNETLDIDKASRIILESVCRLTDAPVGHFGIPMIGGLAGGAPDELHIHAAYHVGVNPQETAPVYLDRLYPQTLDAVRTGQTLHVQKGAASLLIVPMRRENRSTGVIILRRQKPFTPEQQDLVERVIARGAIAIENARLYAAVQAADRAKSEFIGIVAHDLKAPMSSILGYVELTLLDSNLPRPLIKFQQRIRDTIRRMEVLVSDLADISRIESGRFFMEPHRVAVSDVLQSLRDSTALEMQARGHRYIEQIEPDLPDLYVDYYRLLQVLINLVSNAYKYTPNGGTITVTVRRHGDRVAFSVADTGIGLSAEAIKKLGTRFWRSDDEYTRSQPGTGLGFAITRSLVEQMGSRILIESEVGRGSTFTFSVPTASGGGQND